MRASTGRRATRTVCSCVFLTGCVKIKLLAASSATERIASPVTTTTDSRSPERRHHAIAKLGVNIYGATSRWWEGQQSVGLGVADLSKIGLSPAFSQAPLLPLVYAGQYAQQGTSYSSFQRYVRYVSTGAINLTREIHAHTLKFGFNYDVNLINIRQDAPANFSFANSQTSCDPGPDPGSPCAVNLNTTSTGNPIASMLIGVGSGGGTNFNMDPAMSQHSFGLYLQDNWRATPRLTIYAGLRYENQRPATERHNRVAYFDPNAVNSLSQAYGSTVKGAFEFAGVDGRSRSEWEPDNLNFSPRLGFAYQLSPRLTARAGSGIFYTPTSAMLGYDGGGQSPGYTSQTPWVPTVNNQGYIPGNLVSNPFPNGLVKPTGNAAGDQTLIGIGVGTNVAQGAPPRGRTLPVERRPAVSGLGSLGRGDRVHRCSRTQTVVWQSQSRLLINCQPQTCHWARRSTTRCPTPITGDHGSEQFPEWIDGLV